jgi:hypothetical protein
MNFLENLLKSLFPEEVVPTDERRSSVRLNFRFEVEVRTQSETFKALVSNLTLTGLCLEVPKLLKEGTELTLCRDTFGPPFNGTVMWSKKIEGGKILAGVECELDEDKLIESWLEPALVQAGFEASYVGERRQLVRVPGRVRCELTQPDGGGVLEGLMLDLSVGGALVESGEEIAVGTKLKYKTHPIGRKIPALEGRALVKSTRRRASGEWLIGLSFEGCEDEKIRAYMNRMLSSKEL